ncbi:MAG: alpha/beta hydrolase, partial [Mycobacterium sp.]|nr:alpha/beta hydrolase [Mycobacterium sp.]
MTGFTVAQARGWRADPLTGIADDWDRTAGAVQNHADAIDSAVSGADWRGTAARAATAAISPVTAGLRRLCRALVLAAAEARDAAATVTAARDRVLAELATAAAEG